MLARDTPSSAMSSAGLRTGRLRSKEARMRSRRADMRASIPHDRLAPHVQRALLVGPDAHWPVWRAHLDLRRDLGQVAIGITHHEEHVIARAVAADAPDNGLLDRRHVIAPRLHLVPTRGFERLVIEARLGGTEQRQRMVEMFGAQKTCTQR